MASSYTGHSGIEKPAQGDQTGEWGTTINLNMDIIDRSINGVLALALSGTSHTLTTTDGTLTDGMYKVLVLGGSPSGTNTITIAPNDADKVYFVVNSSGQTATFSQGSGANVSILNGHAKIIYADGAGSGAAVVDFTEFGITAGTVAGSRAVIVDANKDIASFRNITLTGELDAATLDVSGAVDIAGTTNLDVVDIDGAVQIDATVSVGVNDTGYDFKLFGATSGAFLLWDESADKLLTAGGALVDIVKDKLMIGGTAVTTTAAELNKLDGVTSTTTELNYVDVSTLGTSEASKAVTVDASGDLLVPDSDKFKFGAGSDMQVYHDGTNSYITNATGELKLATESSGIAIAIGHSTSEVTFGDNVTVTGNFDVNGTTTTINTTNLTVTDPLVKFGQGYTGTAYDEGFIVTRGNGSATNIANKGLIWDESADEFAAVACNTEDGTTAGNVTINSYADLQVDKLTGGSLDISGDVDVDGALETDGLSIAGTNVTSSAAELNKLDGATVVVGEINALDLGSTAIGTAIASKAVVLDANKDYTGVRNFTISGELDAATLDISGAIDVAGNSVLASVDVTGVATAATFEPDGDTAAADNAAIGYTAAEGLILTGQGSTNDVTIKNDADADVIEIPTGTTNVTIAGTLGTGGAITSGAGLLIADAGTIGTASDTNAIAISSAGLVSLSATNAIKLNVGTTAQRPTAAAGQIRYNSTLGQFEGYGSAWGSLGGGATGGGSDTVFVENSDDVTTDYSITSGKNAMSVGPITIEAGIDVTIPSGSRWVIL